MKHLLFTGFLSMICFYIVIDGQILPPDGVIRPPADGKPLSSRQKKRIEEIVERTRRREELQEELMPEISTDYPTKIPLQLKDKLKISHQEETQLINLSNDKKTKFVKIWNNICGAKVIDANSENCLDKADFSIVSVYSFYLKDYKPFFADFSISNGQIVVDQNRQFQMLTEIGDVSLKEINEEFAKAKTLLSFDLSKIDIKKAKEVFETGFSFYDVKISNSAKFEENKTYLLRSIFDDKERASGFTRVDKMIAFRILKVEDGFLTIAWKDVKTNE